MSQISNPFQSDELSVFEVVQNGSLDVWMAACGTIFGVSPLDHQETNQYFARTWLVEPVIVAQSRYHSMVANHGKHHVQESGEYVNVHRYINDSSVALDSAGVPLICEPGDIVLLDYARPFTSVHPNSECQSFIVPQAAIGYAPSDDPHAIILRPETRMGKLIGQEMDAILAQLSRGQKTISSENLQRFLGCVEVATSPDRASESARARARESLKRAIVAFIEQHLASPDLNVALILRNF
ncbi:MAG: hypothetical protein AAF331_12560, partial [Pseudomonadota bacterium]